MCQCQQTNCGCSETTTTYNLCNTCPPETCTCPVQLSTDCITLSEDLSCSGVVAGTNFTEAIQQLDEFICTAIEQAETSINLVNVGTGATIYKGVDGIGRKEIKSLTSTDNSITLSQNTNTIDFSVNFPEVDQDNFVRQLIIEKTDLPSPYDRDDICDYILALPSSERTIEETDSKWNIIVALTGDGIIYLQVYELQNIGKGIITALTRDNLLLLKKEDIGFQAVLNVDPVLTTDNIVTVESKFDLTSGTGGTVSGIKVYDESYETSTIPFVQIGKNLGNTGLIGSLQFFSDRVVLYDGLNKGIVYNGDYEANFTNRSLITKAYADSLAGTTYSAGTGLSLVGTTFNNTAPDQTVVLTQGGATTITGTYPNFTISSTDTNTTYSAGIGLELVGTTFNTVNLQKAITADYTLLTGDNNYSIKVDNGATPITITVPSGLPQNFFAGITQKGTADVTFLGSGTTIANPTGLKIKGQGYCIGLEQIGATNAFDLLGDTQA